MPRPGPAGAVELLPSVLSNDSAPRAAADWLVEIILNEQWADSRSEALELAQSWEDRFIRRLQRKLGQLHDVGRHCPFAFNSSSPYMIQGSAFIEPGVDSRETQERKRRRSRLTDYLDFFETMNPEEFEMMCRGILALYGVEDPALTPYRADEGIDFYGRLSLGPLLEPDNTLPGLHTVLKVWMVGQAKHYQLTQAATPDIREVIGSVDLARAGAYSRVERIYTDLQIRLCDPVFYLFFTTGTVSRDGWRLLQRSGAVGMDGEMVANLLADRGIGMTDEEFDEAELREWLEAYGST